MNEEDVFGAGIETFPGHLPWAFRDPCGECAESKKGACQRHWAVLPKLTIRQPFEPETVLPCAGLWEEHDQEFLTPEVEARCAGCPAATWCLQSALANDEVGIWAGTTYDQRRSIKLGEHGQPGHERERERTAA